MRHILILGLALTVITPAFGRSREDGGKQDPNKVICRTEDVIGSRLQTTKTCLTASEWADKEREARRTTERIQAFKPNNGN